MKIGDHVINRHTGKSGIVTGVTQYGTVRVQYGDCSEAWFDICHWRLA